jgi:hypothetical protein
MEPLNDNELQTVLRQWDPPAAPEHLERRIFGRRPKQPWYVWFLTGAIRVPVPAAAVLLVLLAALTYMTPRNPVPAREIRMSDFQPVSEMKPRIVKRPYESN